MTPKQNITATAGTEGKPETLDETCPHCGIDWRQHSWSTFDECKPPSDQPHKRQDSTHTPSVAQREQRWQDRALKAEASSDQWQRMYDDELTWFNDITAQRDALLAACKDLVKEVHLGKLNVRKDFSLMVAHAQATKAIASVERKQS